MSEDWLMRIFEIETFIDQYGFERSNTKLVNHKTFLSKSEALIYKKTIEKDINKRVIIKPKK